MQSSCTMLTDMYGGVKDERERSSAAFSIFGL